MEAILINGIYYDLPAIEKDCWQRLANGALHNRDEWHNAVVANVNAAGVNMRTLVLRKTWPVEKKLAFFTDTRSRKWAELQLQNNIGWLFYDTQSRIQVRANGTATLHHKDELADAAWEETNTINRVNYLSKLPPSTAINLPFNDLPSGTENAGLTREQTEAGRVNFGVVATSVKTMDWLWLNGIGHCRAGFVYGEDGKFNASWLVP